MENEVLFNRDFIQMDDVYYFIDQLNIGLYLCDFKGNTLETNIYFQSFFSFTMDELKGKTIYDLFGPQDAQSIIETINTSDSKKPNIQEYVVKGKKKDNEIIYLKVLSFHKHDNSKIIIAFQDITKNKQNELQLSKTFKDLEDVRFALDKATTVSITDVQGNILYVNDLFCEVSKYTREELIGQNHRIVGSGKHPKEYFEKMWTTIGKGEIFKGEVCNKAKDGTIWWADATIVPFLNKQGKPYQYVAIRSDITDRKMMEEKIHHMAYYDFLTSLPNRSKFETYLEQEYEQAKQTKGAFSLMIVELHNLRDVYDSLGKEIGDRLLKAVAQRLNRFVDKKGIISRIEGYEFAIIFPSIANGQINNIAHELLLLFEQPFSINDFELYLTTNMGISIYPESGDTVLGLKQNANSALYQAKEFGINTFQICSPNMSIGSYKRFTLQNDFRKAVKNKEFFVVYQPRINPKTNKIIAAEALIRWEHPNWGVVSPNEFITLAEEEGLIGSIGEMVMQYACEQNKKWQDAGMPPIIISVNFSVQQFLQMDLIDRVEEILINTGLDPKWLEIEITETAIMKDEPIVLSKIEKLKGMGIKIAIDDFGTGYCSLSYLQKLKANTLKIDTSFIKDIAIESSSLEIVSAIIHLAQKLKMRTVAEGVETAEQLRLLNEINCDEIQGYLYSKPVTGSDFELLLKKKICMPDQINKIVNMQIENRRKFFRIDLPFPLEAYMTITELAGKKVNLGSTKILILDIGPGGLRIETNIKLPVRSDLLLKFTTELFGEKLNLYGSIVWNEEFESEYEAYGINFIIEDNARGHLTFLLNKLQVKLRQNTIIPDCSFVIEDKKSFFNA